MNVFFPPSFFLSSDHVVSGEVVTMPGISVSPFFSQGVPCKYVHLLSAAPSAGCAALAMSPVHPHVLTCTMIFSKVLG